MDTSDAIRVRYKGDKPFEILVEPELAKEVKLDGKEHDIQRLLFVQEVFLDAEKGERASTEDLDEEFGTKQLMEAAKTIFEKGEMQLTTDQKAEMREDNRKQIINMIARRAQNPKTGNPHPPQRVENALEEAGFHADPFEDIEEQFDRAIKSIRPIIPVSLDEKTVAIRIPVDKAGKAYDKIQRAADVGDEQWGDKYFTARVTIAAGALTELMDEIQEIAKGEAEMKEV
ncbi:ribosome assembly factor SBDS [Candidatus Nanohalococcus occultus]|uniref:ribosome assembly factor SBDS n=1 Tax=Candidatus Nanohalococcus occultus TaxID=2978047 RepID=UPI0039DFA9E5